MEPNTEESICLTSCYLTVFYRSSIEIDKMFINTIPPAVRSLVGHSHERLVDSPGYDRKKSVFTHLSTIRSALKYKCKMHDERKYRDVDLISRFTRRARVSPSI